MATIPLQSTFDTVVAHLRKQGCKSEALKVGCEYRGPNGLMCAIGVLIPDERYTPACEASLPDDGLVCDILTEIGHDIPLCMELQRLHDCDEVEDWEKSFSELAAKFNLTYTPPVPA